MVSKTWELPVLLERRQRAVKKYVKGLLIRPHARKKSNMVEDGFGVWS